MSEQRNHVSDLTPSALRLLERCVVGVRTNGRLSQICIKLESLERRGFISREPGSPWMRTTWRITDAGLGELEGK